MLSLPQYGHGDEVMVTVMAMVMVISLMNRACWDSHGISTGNSILKKKKTASIFNLMSKSKWSAHNFDSEYSHRPL